MTTHEIAEKELLRFTTCGSVDDGKSTLIGRLLYDHYAIYEDQLEAIRKTSLRKGASYIDLSLLTDGLSAERAQGITIDVAYRYFSTSKRRFIIADVPGHEQYTSNMVTGASTADLAVLLVDSIKGLLIQSKRHLFIAALLQIPHILIAINKMDVVNYSQDIFEKIKNDFTEFSTKLNIRDLQFIPLSALDGKMVVHRGNEMGWYGGSTLIQYLENLHVASDRNLIDFRFPVQLIVRPNSNFRGYAGRIESGAIRKGEEIIVLPSGKRTSVKSIVTYEGEQSYAYCSQSIILTLENDIDISRGDMVVRCNNLPKVSNEFYAVIFWMSEEVMCENNNYIIKHTTKITKGFISRLLYKIDVDTLHRQEASSLNFNDIGRAYIKTYDSLHFDAYERNRNTGCFIIIDEITYDTVGAGIILDQNFY